ncbi:hypothetical protein PBI_SCTP2_21 [Salicola phage SCTP-2]|nr:hypothetical protein PBI_SCTP2_21 [Salicola phage SCTP-2]
MIQSTNNSSKGVTLEAEIDEAFAYLSASGKNATTIVFNNITLMVERQSNIDNIIADYHSKLEQRKANR